MLNTYGVFKCLTHVVVDPTGCPLARAVSHPILPGRGRGHTGRVERSHDVGRLKIRSNDGLTLMP